MATVEVGQTVQHLEFGALRVFKIDTEGDMVRLWTYDNEGYVVRLSKAPFDHVTVS